MEVNDLKYGFRQLVTKYEYLIRLIFAILALITAPFSLSQYVITRHTHKEIMFQNKQHYAESAVYFRNFFNDMVSTINDNALKIQLEKKLVRDTVFSNYWYRIEAVDILKNYREMVPNVESVAIYFNDTDVVLTSDYTYHLDRFIEYYSANNEKMTDELHRIFNGETDYDMKILTSFDSQMPNNPDNPDNPNSSNSSNNSNSPNSANSPNNISSLNNVNNLNYPNNQNKPRIIISIPIRTDFSLEKNATVMYVVSNSSLSSGFLGLLSNESYGLAIFDKNSLLYTSNDFNYTLKTDKSFLDFMSQHESNFFTYKSNNVSNNVFKVPDNKSGLTFVLVVPESTVIQKVNLFYNKMISIIVILVLVIILVSISAIYISYRPISDLIKSIKSRLPSVGISGEIKTIKNLINKMYDENNVMHEKVTEQRMLLMDHIFSNILYGFPVPTNNKLYSDEFLKNKSFFVINIYNFNPGNMAIEQLTQTVLDKLHMHIFVTDGFYGNYMTIICIKNQSDDTEQLAADFNLLLEQTFKMKLISGIGNTVDNITEIRSSYLQALTNLEHNMKLIHSRKSDDEPASLSFSNENNSTDKNDLILHFLQCIQNGFEDDSLKQLSLIFDKLIEQQNYVFKKNYFCYELVCLYLNTIKSMNIEIDEHFFNDIISFNSTGSLRKRLEEHVSVVCKTVNKRHETVDRHLKRLMVSYVDSHFTDHDISLIQIADNFNLSMYTCSRLFKEFTGMGFKEYILGKRMDLAKQLLLTTNKRVNEISNEVGFENSTYFMSRFKACFGLTPSKFRNTVEFCNSTEGTGGQV
jgi:two-component system response regulator YesN